MQYQKSSIIHRALAKVLESFYTFFILSLSFFFLLNMKLIF